MTGKLDLPAGFRFHPTDEELVMHYLCRKCASQSISVSIIAEIDLYKYDPWILPGMANYGEKEWYFFSPRDRKYPNGSRPNRSAGSGYWKATGADKPIGRPSTVGIKKALVFYSGKAPKGVKTNWIMHEYRLANVDRSAGKKTNSRLDDWVLCRIYNKKGSLEKQNNSDNTSENLSEIEDRKPQIFTPGSYNTAAPPQYLSPQFKGYGKSDSAARNQTGSSCSEQVLSPEFVHETEVQSEPKWNELEKAFDSQFNYMDSFAYDQLGPQAQFGEELFPPLHDMFMYMDNTF